jgi:hypothetical protein
MDDVPDDAGRGESSANLRPDQLADLLSLATEDAALNRELEDTGPLDLLGDILVSPLSLDAAVPDSVPFVLGRPCDELAGHKGELIGDVLLHADVELDALRALKDYGKNLVHRARGHGERAAATAVYYAAIANALVHRGERISSHPVTKLGGYLDMMAGKPWVPEELRTLYDRARRACSG